MHSWGFHNLVMSACPGRPYCLTGALYLQRVFIWTLNPRPSDRRKQPDFENIVSHLPLLFEKRKREKSEFSLAGAFPIEVKASVLQDYLEFCNPHEKVQKTQKKAHRV